VSGSVIVVEKLDLHAVDYRYGGHSRQMIGW